MPSSDLIPLPPDWLSSTFRTRDLISAVAIVSFAAVSLLVGIGAAATGRYAVLAFCLLFATMMGLIATFGIVTRLSNHTVGAISTTLDGATRLHYSGVRFCLVAGLMVSCACICLCGAIAVIINTGQSGFPGAAVVLGALGALCASFFVPVILGTVRPGEVLLTADGIRQRGWSFQSYIPWNSIVSVTATTYAYKAILLVAYANAPWERGYTTRYWRIDRLPPVPMIELDCSKFAIDAATVYRLVAFYFDNPQSRIELGTAAAVARAQQILNNGPG